MEAMHAQEYKLSILMKTDRLLDMYTHYCMHVQPHTHTHTQTPHAKLYQSKTHTLYINTSHAETQAYTKAIKHICTQTTLKPAAATLVYLAGLEKCVSSAAYRCGPEQLDEYFTSALCNGNTGTRSCSSRPFWCSSPRSGSRCDKQLGKKIIHDQRRALSDGLHYLFE